MLDNKLIRAAGQVAVVATVALAAALGAGCGSSGSSARPKDGGSDARDAGLDTIAVMCTVDQRMNGEQCSCPTQCESGFCADGFCCETACAGTCLSCGLPSAPGVCTPIPAGAPPRDPADCKAEGKSTCGRDGTCDGTGQCRNHVEGTVCKAGMCEVDAVVGTYTCDGARGCSLGAATVCAPFSCNGASGECFGKCRSDADCVSGRRCVDGSCGPKMNGAVCETGAECASTFCADGVCCNSSCEGECRACNLVGHLGSCQPLAPGLGDSLCPRQAAATCGTTGVCDGFGACSTFAASTPCGASVCSGATAMNTARTCDGAGTCLSSQLASCGTYRCANGRCNSRCTSAADCADGVACVNNNCGPKVDGQPCTANADCQNLHCIRDTATGPGICCNTECTGACRSCAVAGALGRCTPVPGGTIDPRRTCADMTAASCGTDGRCDGVGGCRRYASGTVCGGETCANDSYTPPSVCNGAGQCTRPGATSCAPFHCNANRCFTSCTTNAQCVPPNICGMNGAISSCGLKANGATCSAASECSSNFCSQGVCCNSACTAACRACNLAGSLGACANVNSGADPRRLCVAQAQSTCGTTGQCQAGQCARWASGTQCAAARCMTASTRIPPATCNGAGACVTPGGTNCAPGRCDSVTTTCNSTCTTNPQCTAPAVCVNGMCGTGPAGTGGAGTGGAGTGGAGTGGRGTGGAGTGGAATGGRGTGGAATGGAATGGAATGGRGTGGAATGGAATGGAATGGAATGGAATGGAATGGAATGGAATGGRGTGGAGTGGAAPLPTCGALQLCIGMTPACVCPAGTSCGLLICVRNATTTTAP